MLGKPSFRRRRYREATEQLEAELQAQRDVGRVAQEACFAQLPQHLQVLELMDFQTPILSRPYLNEVNIELKQLSKT